MEVKIILALNQSSPPNQKLPQKVAKGEKWEIQQLDCSKAQVLVDVQVREFWMSGTVDPDTWMHLQ